MTQRLKSELVQDFYTTLDHQAIRVTNEEKRNRATTDPDTIIPRRDERRVQASATTGQTVANPGEAATSGTVEARSTGGG